MFSKEMENLIQATLEDGVLEENEKAALIKRAQKEGVDLDELEIYINSLLQKRQRELNIKNKEAKEAQAQADLEYEKKRAKELRKCPKCGAYIPQLSTVCPECGHIIDKNETDEEIVYLINLLRKFISGEIYESDIELPQKEYRKYKKYYNKNVDYNGSVFCNYNRERIMAEATLYKANPEIQSLLKKIDNPMY